MDASRLRGLALGVAMVLFGGCRRLHKEPFEKVPLGKDQIEVVRLSERPNLVVERVRFWSNEMNEPRFFLALIPKPPKPLSGVFILNHGWYDRPEYLLTDLKVDQVYDDLLGRGEVHPAIVVIPDIRFSSFYRQNSSRYPFANYLTLVAEEVAGTASHQYSIPFARERWGMGGFSFGGYVSLDAGRHYPGRFASVSVVSGIWDRQWSFWPAQPPPPGRLDALGRGRHTVVVPGPMPRLFLACGTDDRLFGTMKSLDDTLSGLGIPHAWSTGPGGHTWKYWSSVLQPMLKFHLGVDQP